MRSAWWTRAAEQLIKIVVVEQVAHGEEEWIRHRGRGDPAQVDELVRLADLGTAPQVVADHPDGHVVPGGVEDVVGDRAEAYVGDLDAGLLGDLPPRGLLEALPVFEVAAGQ